MIVLSLGLSFDCGKDFNFGLVRGLDLGLGWGFLMVVTLNADFCFIWCLGGFFFFGFFRARPGPFDLLTDKLKETQKNEEYEEKPSLTVADVV